jgi:hypothetical protein
MLRTLREVFVVFYYSRRSSVMNLISFGGSGDGRIDQPGDESAADSQHVDSVPGAQDQDNTSQGGNKTPEYRTRRPGPDQNRNQGRHRQHEHFVPSRAAVLATLVKVSQFLMAGLIKPGQANAIVSALRTVLSHLPDENSPAASGAVNIASLREAVTKMPELMVMLESLLSDEQLREMYEDPQ